MNVVIKSEVIKLNCPSCGKLLKIKSEMAGRQLHCPKPECGAVISVPGSPDKSPELKIQVMISVGIVFALIAAVLAIKEIHLAFGWIVSLALVSTVFAAEFLKGYAKAGVLALFTLLGLTAPALFFALERKADPKEIAFFTGSAIFLALAVYAVARNARVWGRFDWRNSARTGENLLSCVVWFAAAVSSISFAWVAYYKFLTSLGQDEYLARRLAFTVFFVVVGVICSVVGRARMKPFLGVVGLVYMAAGVLKALAYDISHTDGVIRIGVFAGCGVALMLGGFLMLRKTPMADPAANASAFIEE